MTRVLTPVLPAVAAAVLVPWTIGIAAGLPHNAVAWHWNTAWAGLDVAIMLGLALTSQLGRRHDRRVALIATATATLMCADAWFDLCTSPSGSPFAAAVAQAAAELTVAAFCLVTALRALPVSAARGPDSATSIPEHDQLAGPAQRDSVQVDRAEPAMASSSASAP